MPAREGGIPRRSSCTRPFPGNDKLLLTVCIGYGGRQDLTSAARQIAAEVHSGLLQPGDVSEALLAQRLSTAGLTGAHGDPDLLIRTGEMRLSNFLLWESAYSELYFCPDLFWPDFTPAELQRQGAGCGRRVPLTGVLTLLATLFGLQSRA